MTLTTYPTTPERPVTRAEIDRLTAIIKRLNDARDEAAETIRKLDHDVDVQRARANVAEAQAKHWKQRWRSLREPHVSGE